MFYSAKIDKLKAQIRDTDVPLCPNSYEPLFTFGLWPLEGVGSWMCFFFSFSPFFFIFLFERFVYTI